MKRDTNSLAHTKWNCKYCALPAKMDTEKLQKNGMNPNNSFVFKSRRHLFHDLLDNELLET